MFRLFLHRRLLSADDAPASAPRERAQRNRRGEVRYAVDHKHLTLLNDQDIFQILDLSAHGLACSVSERAAQRLHVGDVYAARMRHDGTTHGFEARVSWKATGSIGFEILRAQDSTRALFTRLIAPIAIARSLQRIDIDAGNARDEKIWYHGDEDTDLYLWRDPTGGIVAWRLSIGRTAVEWSVTRGIATGSLRVDDGPKSRAEPLAAIAAADAALARDATASTDRLRIAHDIFTALAIPERDALVETIGKGA